MDARLNGLLNPILRSHIVHASSLNYSTTLEGFLTDVMLKMLNWQSIKIAECVNKHPTRARVKSQQEQPNRDCKIYIITIKKVDGVVQ